MSKINKPPLGLQDLLGSQSFGTNPGDLLQGVRPSLDMVPFWLWQNLEYAQDSATATPIVPGNDVVTIAVPQNELWIPWGITAEMSFGGNAIECVWRIAISNLPFSGSGADRRIGLKTIPWIQNQATTAGRSTSIDWQPSTVFVIPGGSVVSYDVLDSNDAGNGTATLRIAYAKLEI